MAVYAEHFAENRIDLSVLPDLTDQHLEKPGVALGDRLKLELDGRDFAGDAGAFRHHRGAQPAASAAPVVQDSTERRQLTVMFCDLVGSTALSASSTLRTCGALLLPIARRCTELVCRNGAMVALSQNIWGTVPPSSWTRCGARDSRLETAGSGVANMA
jgi:class 3 adenylate cyclase